MEGDQNIPNCQTTGDKNMLPAGTLKISPEQNIESISPPDQHNRDTDTVVPEGWKLEKMPHRMLRMSFKFLAFKCSKYILLLHEK